MAVNSLVPSAVRNGPAADRRHQPAEVHAGQQVPALVIRQRGDRFDFGTHGVILGAPAALR
jgi:hypothetical protein